MSVIDLADRFQMSKTTAADTFLENLKFFLIKLTPLVIWPERPELQISISMSLRSKFDCKINAIIGCFELFIDQPSNLNAEGLTWSTYKSHNTTKFSHWYYSARNNLFHSKGMGRLDE